MHEINTLKRLVSKLVLVSTIMILLVATANAYTVVMRGGRSVEVPPTFVLTASTLTYEVSPGVQITLAVTAIDIAATEKANGEQPGSFMKRVVKSGSETDVSPASQTRTITNRDLESVAKRRRESEQAYEVRRKQLQLPTIAESRKQAAAEAAAVSLELRQRRVAQNETEQYWRERATTLRTEMAAVDAEIAFVRARLDEGWPSSAWTSGSFTNSFGVFPGLPSIGFGRSRGNHLGRGRFPGAGRHRQNVFVAPHRGGAFRGRIGFGGGGTRARVFINSGVSLHGRSFGSGNFPAFPSVGIIGGGVIGGGIPAFDYSYERSELITRFNDFGAERAGLRARWRELEEEARRAGAQPGWLRE